MCTNLKNIILNERNQTINGHRYYDSMYMRFIIGKSTETESRLMFLMTEERRECIVTAKWVGCFFLGVIINTDLGTKQRRLFHNLVILNATELYTLKWLMANYVT